MPIKNFDFFGIYRYLITNSQYSFHMKLMGIIIQFWVNERYDLPTGVDKLNRDVLFEDLLLESHLSVAYI